MSPFEKTTLRFYSLFAMIGVRIAASIIQKNESAALAEMFIRECDRQVDKIGRGLPT